MVKGEDAVRRKKNKILRKRLRSSDSAVPARIASIIASKKRRQAGKRRACEGMCFTLPTPDDPFNERHDKKAGALPKKKPKKPPTKKPNKTMPKDPLPGPEATVEKKALQLDKAAIRKKGEGKELAPVVVANGEEKSLGHDGCMSKFLIVCLNAIQTAWEEEGSFDVSIERPLWTSSWGTEFRGSQSKGLSLVDTSGACASREQVAWLVSMAADVFATMEKDGHNPCYPFLVYLVPSQERAIQVRSVCKPLKALGIHTISLHPGAALDHQVRGLKSCEPEFLVSTPERLLELDSLGAIDISMISILVIDGLKDLVGSGFFDKVKSITGALPDRIVVFSDCFSEEYNALLQKSWSNSSDSVLQKEAEV